MSTIAAEENSDSGPKRYRDAGSAERRQIQADVVQRYRYRVFRVVRRHVPWREHWEEAEQEGVIGLLIALEKFDPDRGVPFGVFAEQWIRNEIQRWIDIGVHWRPRRQREGVDPRISGLQRTPESLDKPLAGDDGRTLHDVLSDILVSIEELVEEHILRTRLDMFLATLTEDEKHLLLSEKRDRGGANTPHRRRYLSLVERARAFLLGDHDGDISRSGKTR